MRVLENNKSCGLVPTMGNLHKGHLSLLEKSLEENDISVLSIFVNPTQFSEHEDLDSYPRTLEEDIEKIKNISQGKNVIVFAPEKTSEIYPVSPLTSIRIPSLESKLCGISRPGHFNGVCQVVYRLFNMTQPKNTYFGQKDYQQLLIIKQMALELFPEITIKGLPIYRESNGLAMSSRNNYLESKEIPQALTLIKTLKEIKAFFTKNSNLEETLKKIQRIKNQNQSWDYLELLNAENLSKSNKDTSEFILAGAYKIRQVRLIDNLVFKI